MNKTIIYQRVTFITALVLLLLLVAAQFLPLVYHEPTLIGQVDLQSTRAQRIAKDALVLEYRPVSEHAQAISELQNMLPVWEAEQSYLVARHNADIQALIWQAEPDYTAIDTAVQKLLADPSDFTQVAIIIQHERNYTLIMSQLSTYIQTSLETFNISLSIMQCSLSVLILAAIIVLYLLARQVKKGIPRGSSQ